MAERDPTDPAALGMEQDGAQDPLGEPQQQGFDPMDWLMQPVHGDLATASWENIFSPEQGGWDRLALVFESAFDGAGMPRALHLVIAGIEIMLLAQEEGAEEAVEQGEEFVGTWEEPEPVQEDMDGQSEI